MQLGTIKLKLNLRYELRAALLAAMETCWVFAVIAFFGVFVQSNLTLSPLPFFLAYWLAMLLGRVPAPKNENVLKRTLILLGVAIIVMLAVVRVQVYPTVACCDAAWLVRYFANVISLRGSLIDVVVSIGAVYMFLRGLGFAQRPLTLWFVGFQFRLGIVVFFFLLLCAAFARVILQAHSLDLSRWLFVYFFVALLAIAMARIEEMASDVSYGARWAITLLASIGLVLFLGLGVLQFLTPESTRWLWVPIIAGWSVIAALIGLLAIPAGIVAGWLVDWLRPLMENFFKGFASNNGEMPQGLQDLMRQMQAAATSPILVYVVRVVIAAIVLVVLGRIITRALNRRMQIAEDEAFIRESLGAAEEVAARAKRNLRNQRPPARRGRNLSADTIRKIYAALVARATDLGLPRRAAETPYEFEPRLEQQWHAQATDIRTITEAYVDVHYAEHEATEAQAKSVREAWERIKQSLKRSAR